MTMEDKIDTLLEQNILIMKRLQIVPDIVEEEAGDPLIHLDLVSRIREAKSRGATPKEIHSIVKEANMKKSKKRRGRYEENNQEGKKGKKEL